MGISAPPDIATPRSPTADKQPVEHAPYTRYVGVLAIAVLIAVLLRVFVLHAYRIPSESMEDTLLVGDFLIAERITYGSTVELPWSRDTGFRLPSVHLPERGDVVIFRGWEGGDMEYIKRCVGLPGDTIEVRNNVLLVNGDQFDRLLALMSGDDARVKFLSREEPDYPLWHYTDRLRNYGPHVVPPGHIFVMGDNRDNSDDSRVNGDVPVDWLRGRPVFIYWSVNNEASWWNPLDRIRWSRIGQLIR